MENTVTVLLSIWGWTCQPSHSAEIDKVQMMHPIWKADHRSTLEKKRKQYSGWLMKSLALRLNWAELIRKEMVKKEVKDNVEE